MRDPRHFRPELAHEPGITMNIPRWGLRDARLAKRLKAVAAVVGVAISLLVLHVSAVPPPAANTWTATAPMFHARSGHTATMLWDERVLVAGGDDQGVPTDWLEIFDPYDNAFTLLNVVLTSSRTGHAATLLYGGQVLVAGGFNASS